MKKLFILVFLAMNLAVSAAGPEAEIDPVEQLINDVYTAWNAHDLEKLFSYYSKDFLTGDGINKDDYKELTKRLWETYPSIQIENQKRTIRNQDQYSNISGIDFFYGESKDENVDLQVKGTLNAVSQGQIFLKKQGKEWKIASDNIQFELVTVFYGNAKSYLDSHQIFFSSPEQVRSGEQYSATLYFVLPENVKATATINQDLIEKPDSKSAEESFQLINEPKLERLFAANRNNHNEVVSSTIILSKGIIEPKLDGILYISKRVNIIPDITKSDPELIIDYPFGQDTAKKADPDTKTKPELDTEE